MRSPTLDANVQFMQEASQMKNSKHVKLKTFFDPCQTHLLYMISLNLSPLSTLCTLQTITYKKSIFYSVLGSFQNLLIILTLIQQTLCWAPHPGQYFISATHSTENFLEAFIPPIPFPKSYTLTLLHKIKK